MTQGMCQNLPIKKNYLSMVMEATACGDVAKATGFGKRLDLVLEENLARRLQI